MPDIIQAKIQRKNSLSQATYQAWCQQASTDPGAFWLEQSQDLDWQKPPQSGLTGSFEQADVQWFADGILNVSANCIDRHLPNKANEIAFYYEGNHPDEFDQWTFQQLHDEVCRAANAFKQLGIEKGDRVCLYMPTCLESVACMLACARIGAVHSVIFAGFSAQALASRINDCQAKLLLTSTTVKRGRKEIPLYDIACQALKETGCIENVMVKNDSNTNNYLLAENHWDYKTITKNQQAECPCENMQAEDPLFILYTSGSTGKPKGLVHTTAGYLLYASFTHRYTFDYQDGDIYWCAADIGWITGHSYIVYGPLCNGTTSVIFAGTPLYPTAERYWQIIDKHQVNIFYTSPTAIRAVRSKGNEFLKTTQRDSLRVLGTVGEPINPNTWQWYYEKAGKEKCSVVDTWWQTETGGIMISTWPGIHAMKPGSAQQPLPGIAAGLLDADNNLIQGPGEGRLIIQQPWPGMARTIYQDHDRYQKTYLSEKPGAYFTGDGASRDEQDYYTISGRVDDVLNVSGHRLGTAEIENAIAKCDFVAEAAVVGYPHNIKGQGIFVFVVLQPDQQPNDELKQGIITMARQTLGAIATPDIIYFSSALPKTRSGKIMRRLLRLAVKGDHNWGDTSTLINPEILEEIKSASAVISSL